VIGAVDIGGTKIAVGVVDDNGKVLSRLASPTDAAGGYANGLARMIDMLRRTSQDAGVEISGIGIGSTGVVYPGSGAFGDVDLLPGWQGNNPVQDMAREFKVKVALENDADASALGEAGWGAGKLKSRLIYVTVGTGIGGGIILDGQLYRGVGMAHPEISHHVIDPSGPDCSWLLGIARDWASDGRMVQHECGGRPRLSQKFERHTNLPIGKTWRGVGHTSGGARSLLPGSRRG